MAHTEKIYQDILRRQQLEQEAETLDRSRAGINLQSIPREESTTTTLVFLFNKQLNLILFFSLS